MRQSKTTVKEMYNFQVVAWCLLEVITHIRGSRNGRVSKEENKPMKSTNR